MWGNPIICGEIQYQWNLICGEIQYAANYQNVVLPICGEIQSKREEDLGRDWNCRGSLSEVFLTDGNHSNITNTLVHCYQQVVIAITNMSSSSSLSSWQMARSIATPRTHHHHQAVNAKNRQTNSQTNRQTDKQTNRQIDTEANLQLESVWPHNDNIK